MSDDNTRLQIQSRPGFVMSAVFAKYEVVLKVVVLLFSWNQAIFIFFALRAEKERKIVDAILAIA